MKFKIFFIIFKGLALKQIKPTFLEGDSLTLIQKWLTGELTGGPKFRLASTVGSIQKRNWKSPVIIELNGGHFLKIIGAALMIMKNNSNI